MGKVSDTPPEGGKSEKTPRTYSVCRASFFVYKKKETLMIKKIRAGALPALQTPGNAEITEIEARPGQYGNLSIPFLVGESPALVRSKPSRN